VRQIDCPLSALKSSRRGYPFCGPAKVLLELPACIFPLIPQSGIDSIQALQLSMAAIGAILFHLNQERGGKLRWDGDENGDLGFPTPE
jgi:hypothetical protein